MSRLAFRCFVGLWVWSCCACDDDGAGTQAGALATPSRRSVEVAIDPALGGTVQLADGPKLTIPADALPGVGAVSIVVSQVTIAQAPTGVASDIWEFRPAGTRFDKPVLVELPFDARGRDSSEYAIAWTKADTRTEFEDLTTTFAGNVARAEVRHFSLGCLRMRGATRVVCDPVSAVPMDANSDGIVDGCECRAGFAARDGECLPTGDAGPAAVSGRGGRSSVGGSAGEEEVEIGNSQIPAANSGSGGVGASGSGGRRATPNAGRTSVIPQTPISGAGASAPVVPTDDMDAGVEPTPPVSAGSSIQITSFMLEVAPGMRFTGVIDQAASTITVTVPADTDVSALRVLIGSNGRSVSPTGTLSFVEPVVFSVTGRSGGTRSYAVTVVSN